MCIQEAVLLIASLFATVVQNKIRSAKIRVLFLIILNNFIFNKIMHAYNISYKAVNTSSLQRVSRLYRRQTHVPHGISIYNMKITIP